MFGLFKIVGLSARVRQNPYLEDVLVAAVEGQGALLASHVALLSYQAPTDPKAVEALACGVESLARFSPYKALALRSATAATKDDAPLAVKRRLAAFLGQQAPLLPEEEVGVAVGALQAAVLWGKDQVARAALLDLRRNLAVVRRVFGIEAAQEVERFVEVYADPVRSAPGALRQRLGGPGFRFLAAAPPMPASTRAAFVRKTPHRFLPGWNTYPQL